MIHSIMQRIADADTLYVYSSSSWQYGSYENGYLDSIRIACPLAMSSTLSDVPSDNMTVDIEL